MKNNYIVYKHTNKINNKCYIGITQQEAEKRWKNGQGYSSQEKFYRAIKKYGWSGFEHEIVASNLTVEEANKLEKSLIIKYNSINNGYNITEGGENDTYTKSPETIKKLKNLIWITNGEINKRIYNSESLTNFPGFYYGFTRTKMQQQKQIEKNIAYKDKKQKELEIWLASKPICQTCGKIMTVKYGCGKYCCKSCAVTHKHSAETKAKISALNIAGICGNKGKKFTDDHKNKIGAANKGKVRTDAQKEASRKAHLGQKAVNAKKVRCIETGEIFDSILAATKAYHCDVSLYLRGKVKKAKYNWELI